MAYPSLEVIASYSNLDLPNFGAYDVPMLRRSLVRALPLAASVAVLVIAPKSEAHFQLVTPASWMSQDAVGAPEKLGPCGDEDDTNGAATPSGIVTAYQVGDTITVTIDEKIFHPGHYRIALSTTSRSQLPPEPLVEAGATPCGTVPIEDPPVFPVLADNVFPHTTAFTSPQTTTVTLPSNVTCTKCTLQVIEFMSDHPLNPQGGCFYHHCADISVGVSSDAGANPNPDASVGAENEPTQGGCGCSVPTSGAPAAAGVLALVAALAARLRRRRS